MVRQICGTALVWLQTLLMFTIAAHTPASSPTTPTAVNFTSTIPLMQVRWTLGMFGRALIFKESTLKLEKERKIAIRMARNLILCTPHL